LGKTADNFSNDNSFTLMFLSFVVSTSKEKRKLLESRVICFLEEASNASSFVLEQEQSKNEIVSKK
jgi:hypothetical protein